MRHLTARLERGYCSINIANQRLITVIRFVVKSYTYPWKVFVNKLHLVLHALKILFSGIVCRSCRSEPNRARACQDTGSADSSTGNHWNTAERPSRCLTKLPQLVEQTAKRIRLPDTHLIEWQSYHAVTGPSETRWSLPLELLPILSLSIGNHCLLGTGYVWVSMPFDSAVKVWSTGHVTR